ncbi:MAG: glycosyltransferase family 2 protein [bacterium]
MMPKVALIYLSFKSGKYLSEALNTIKSVRYPRDRFELVIVDNKVPGDDSAAVIKATVLPRSGVDLPKITLLENPDNLGFAGGMNTGMKFALENVFDYVMLLNQDGEVDSGIIENAVRVAEADLKIGAVQCLIRLHPETHLLNGYGNELHYLGLGWSGGYRLKVHDARPTLVHEIGYASGAAVLYRASALRDVGIFDEVMFLYHEDTDLSVRMRLRNWRIVIAPRSDFYHKYEFTRSIMSYYWMLRNQLVLFFTLPKKRTILLLLPMQIVLNSATLLFSFKGGWWRQSLRAYGFFLKPSTWKYLAKRRREIQLVRLMSDREAYAICKSEVVFQDVDNWLLRHVGNPMMRLYWKIAYPLMRW